MARLVDGEVRLPVQLARLCVHCALFEKESDRVARLEKVGIADMLFFFLCRVVGTSNELRERVRRGIKGLDHVARAGQDRGRVEKVVEDQIAIFVELVELRWSQSTGSRAC